jgi:excisionase family DNA binding protein
MSTTVRRDKLLTTGEVAEILGSSRQHVVDLCNRGVLTYETTGTHRRVPRSVVESLLGVSSMTRDQKRSLRLGCAVAGKVVRDPQRWLSLARRNLSKMQAIHTRGQGAALLAQWERLLDGPLEGVLEALTSPSPRARELRQNTPFAGVLTPRERLQVLSAFSGRRLASRSE